MLFQLQKKQGIFEQMGCAYLITERKPMNAANGYQTHKFTFLSLLQKD